MYNIVLDRKTSKRTIFPKISLQTIESMCKIDAHINNCIH